MGRARLQRLPQTDGSDVVSSDQQMSDFGPPLLCVTFSSPVFNCLFGCVFNLYMSYFPLLYSLTYTERCETKSLVRANQARPRDVQAKKQQSATLPASSKPAGGAAAAAARHRDSASAAKKAGKTTGKTGSSTQAKANPRNANSTNRGNGKFGWVRRRLGRQNSHLCLHHRMENVLESRDDSQRSHRTP